MKIFKCLHVGILCRHFRGKIDILCNLWDCASHKINYILWRLPDSKIIWCNAERQLCGFWCWTLWFYAYSCGMTTIKGSKTRLSSWCLIYWNWHIIYNKEQNNTSDTIIICPIGHHRPTRPCNNPYSRNLHHAAATA